MTPKERIKTIFNFEVPDRIGIFDAPWPETVARWRDEGLPGDIHVNEYFNYDVDECILADTSLGLQEKIIESNEKYIIYSDSNGVTSQVLKGQTGAPLVLDYLVKTKRDWDNYKQLLKPSKERIKFIRWGEYETINEGNIISKPESWQSVLRKYRKARKKNKFMFFLSAGPLENTTHMIDAQEVYVKLIDDPAFMVDIFNTMTDLTIAMYKEIKMQGLEVDGFHFSDDIAYKNGMLFSPNTYKELLFPCHKKLCDFFKSEGLPVMYHTDGKLDEVLPLALEVGVTAIQPIEAKASNDIRKLKKTYGRDMVLVGNIDVNKMAGSKGDIEEEVKSKILIAKENGGYLYHSDHSVPPSVSLENYRYTMELVHKYGKY